MECAHILPNNMENDARQLHVNDRFLVDTLQDELCAVHDELCSLSVQIPQLDSPVPLLKPQQLHLNLTPTRPRARTSCQTSSSSGQMPKAHLFNTVRAFVQELPGVKRAACAEPHALE
jgi:hypothetical protein